MPEAWEETTLGAVTEVIAMGPFGSSIKVETFVPDGVPVISGRHLRGTRLVEDEFNFITEEHADRLSKANVRRGDVVLTHAGTIGQVAYIPAESRFSRYCLSQRQFFMRPRTDLISAEFLTLFLESSVGQDLLLSARGGTGVPSILKPVTHSRAIPLALPSLAEQRRIVDLVSALDALVDAMLNEVAALHDLGFALLAWFPHRESTNEWRQVPFDAAIDFREGPGIMAVDFRDDGVPLIRLAGLTTGQSLLSGCNFLDPVKVDRKWTHFRVEVGDVLLSTSASLGRVAVVDEEAAGAVPYTGIIRMRPATDAIDAGFIPWILRSISFTRQVQAAGVGITMAHFGPSHLRKMTLDLPPLAEQRRIASVLEHVSTAEQRLGAELDQVRALRSALLTCVLQQRVVLPASYDALLDEAM